jgi:spore coat protein U-like protein
MIRSSIFALAIATTGLLSASLTAGTVTGGFPVTAAVQASCVINSANDASFGNYDSVVNKTTPLDISPLTTSISCVSGTAFSVALDQGKNADAGSTCDAPVRRLKSSTGAFLSYNSYLLSDHANAWGCGAANQRTGTSTSVNSAKNFGLLGRLAAGQDVPSGTYSDQLTLTVTF